MPNVVMIGIVRKVKNVVNRSADRKGRENDCNIVCKFIYNKI